jgi:hypothetical protein
MAQEAEREATFDLKVEIMTRAFLGDRSIIDRILLLFSGPSSIFGTAFPKNFERCHPPFVVLSGCRCPSLLSFASFPYHRLPMQSVLLQLPDRESLLFSTLELTDLDAFSSVLNGFGHFKVLAFWNSAVESWS